MISSERTVIGQRKSTPAEPEQRRRGRVGRHCCSDPGGVSACIAIENGYSTRLKGSGFLAPLRGRTLTCGTEEMTSTI